MARQFSGGRLVIATHNPGKVREIADLLAPHGTEVVSAGDLGLPEPEETGDTFLANADLKARASALGANLPALADDSGLVVRALNGAPGILSARFSGPDADDSANNAKLLDALRDTKERSAHFYCALVFLANAHDPSPLIATADIE